MKTKRMLKIMVPTLLIVSAALFILFSFGVPFNYPKYRFFKKPKIQWKFVEKTVKSVKSDYCGYNGIRDPDITLGDKGFYVSFIKSDNFGEEVKWGKLDKYGNVIKAYTPLVIEEFGRVYSTSPSYILRNTFLSGNNCGFAETIKDDDGCVSPEGEILIKDIQNDDNYTPTYTMCWEVASRNYGYSLKEHNGKIYLAYPKYTGNDSTGDEIIIEVWDKADECQEITKTLDIGMVSTASKVTMHIITDGTDENEIKLFLSWLAWDKIYAKVIDPFAGWSYKKVTTNECLYTDYCKRIYKGYCGEDALYEDPNGGYSKSYKSHSHIYYDTILCGDSIVFCIRDIITKDDVWDEAVDKLIIREVFVDEDNKLSLAIKKPVFLINSDLKIPEKNIPGGAYGWNSELMNGLTPSLAYRKDGTVGIAFLGLKNNLFSTQLRFIKYDSTNNILLIDKIKDLTGFTVNRNITPKIVYAYYRWNFLWVEGHKVSGADALKNKGYKLKYGCILFDE